MHYCGFILLWTWLFSLLGITAAYGRAHESWRDLGLYGGQMLSVASDPQTAAIAYAGSWDGDGLFQSTNGGRTWFSIPEADPSWFRNLEVFDIATDPHAPGTVWVANSTFVDVSRDYGATWETFFFAFDEVRFCYAVAVDPHDRTGNTVYVGTGGPDGTDAPGEIYKTGDGGRSWEPILHAAGHDILDIAADPLTPHHLWAVSAPWSEDPAAKSRVLHSSDGGTTWAGWDRLRTPQGTSRAFGFPGEIHVPPGHAGTVFTCGQDGITAFARGFAEAPEWVVRQGDGPCTALCFEQPATAYAAFDTTLFASFDGWLSRTAGATAPDRFLCMIPVSETPAAVLAGGHSRGMFQSTDGALTWQARNHGIRANTVFAAAVSPFQPELTLCGTRAGAFVQHREGGPWVEATPRSTYAFAFHPGQPATWYAGFDNAIGKTAGHGEEWSTLLLARHSETHTVSALSIIAGTPPVIVAGLRGHTGNYGALVRVHDTGDTFAAAATETVFTAAVPVNALTHHPCLPQRLFAGTGWFYAPGIPGALYASTDRGRTWHASGLQDVVVNSIAVAPSNPDLLYAACGDSGLAYAGIYKSTDGGATWHKLTRGLPPRISATDIWTAGNGDVVYAALYSAYTQDLLSLGGVYVTRDGGDYWTQIGLSDYMLYALACRESSSDTLWRSDLSAAGAAADTGTHTVLAGSSSGLYGSSTAGAAALTGSVACAATGAMLDSAIVSASCGANCISADGYYMMLVPPGTHTITAQAPGYRHSSAQSVTVLPSGHATRQIYLQPVSEGGDCFLGSIMRARNQADDLTPLRLLRAQVLMKTPLGRRLADLYYRHAVDIRRALDQDPAAARSLADIIRTALPCIAALLADEPCVISPELSAGVPPVLAALEQTAGPRLRRDLHALRKMLKSAAWPTLLSGPEAVSFTRRHPPRPVTVPAGH